MLRPTRWLAIGFLLPALAATAAPATPAGPRKIRIAVMEIRPLGTEAHKAELLSEVALTEAANIDRFEVIGRSDISSMIGFDQQKKVLGCTDDSNCLAEIGGALGVDQVMVGTLGKLGALYRVDIKLVDAKKARVTGRFGESVEGSEEKLVAAVQRGVRKLLLPLGGELPIPGAVADATAKPKPVPTPAAPDLAAARPPASTPAAAAVSVQSSDKGGGWSRRTWGWALGGTGVAVVGVGALFGLQAKAAFDAEKKASAAGDATTYASKKDEAKSKSMLADVCFVAGGVTAGVATYLLLTSGPAVAVAPTEGGMVAVVSGRF
jgi:TolB-like protein